ncbi:hypothetical protein ACTSOS_004725 [Escherichia coli]|uniref:hypothetical protein n=1 Tax=Escherichia coli TaxID=562 RepID=UPI002019E00D|nr:hypothetical protein [Escherichia coli]
MVKLLLVINEFFNKNNDLKTIARFDGKTLRDAFSRKIATFDGKILRDASSKIILSADAEVGIVVMAFVAELI